jgi:hypothetical protein
VDPEGQEIHLPVLICQILFAPQSQDTLSKGVDPDGHDRQVESIKIVF